MSDASPATAESVGAQVAKGAAILSGMRLLARLVGFINTLILARLLVPEDFGVVAIGFAVLQLLQNLSDIGVSQAVIKFREDDKDQTDTLFTLSFIRGVIVGIVIAALAVPAGMFYEDPRVTELFFALGLFGFMASLINPRFYEFERDLQYMREALLTLAVKLASVVASVAVAITFQSFWAIAAGYGAGLVLQVAMSYVLRPYRPRFSFKAADKLLGFTGWLAGMSALIAINNKANVLIVGRLLGTADTGVYHVGEQVAGMTTTEITAPIARAIYPGLSTLQTDDAEMRRAFLQGTQAMSAIAIPAAMGTAFIAHDLSAVLLGARWPDAPGVIQVFAPAYGLAAIYSATTGVALAKGMTKNIFFRELFFLILKMPIFVIAAWKGGLIGAAFAAAFCALIHSVLQARLYKITTGFPAIEPLMSSWRSLAALGGMAAWFWGVRPFVPDLAEWPTLIRLLMDAVAGGVGYVAMHIAVWKLSGAPDGIEKTIIDLVRKKLNSTSAEPQVTPPQ